jgi:hypothetical protein
MMFQRTRQVFEAQSTPQEGGAARGRVKAIRKALEDRAPPSGEA